MTLDKAKQLREQGIEVRKNSKAKGKFGYYYYGNEGTVMKWYPHGRANPFVDGPLFDWKNSTQSSL